MRTMHTLINATTGCSASTARGTLVRPSPMTTAAEKSPAAAQAKVSRLISPNPVKRHIACGTLNMAKAMR